jgi:hypothetical protein
MEDHYVQRHVHVICKCAYCLGCKLGHLCIKKLTLDYGEIANCCSALHKMCLLSKF